MEGNEIIKTDNFIAWLITVFIFVLLIGRVRHIAGWILMKLYEFFIGSKKHAAP